MPSRIEKPSRRRAFYALLVAGSLAGIVALGLTFGTQLTSNGQSAQLAQLRAKQAGVSARLALEEHRQTVLTVCENQNHRHAATLRELDVLIRHIAERASPKRRHRLKQSSKFTVLLIDALAPYQDCNAVATRLSRP